MLKSIAKILIRAFPSQPDLNNFHNWQVFNHVSYRQGSETEKRDIRRRSSLAGYAYEQQAADSWLQRYFFPAVNNDQLRGASLLDLGCFTGGRLVAWAEQYSLGSVCGLDINPLFAEAASEFAKEKGVAAKFATGFGEALPYADNSFDFIVATDVFEHVQDLRRVLSECYRTLKPGGKLLCVFPQFFQPLEAHLGLATKLPALHWLFPSKVLSDAYFEVLSERGESASWYAPTSQTLKPWERLPSLNGITVAKFRRLLSEGSWLIEWRKKPILSDGRRSKQLVFRTAAMLFAIPARMPVLEELFLGRICCILKKPH